MKKLILALFLITSANLVAKDSTCEFEDIYKEFNFNFVFRCYDKNLNNYLDPMELLEAYSFTFYDVIQDAIKNESEENRKKYAYRIFLFIVDKGRVPKSFFDKIRMTGMDAKELQIPPRKITALLEVLRAHLCKFDEQYNSGLCSNLL